MTSLAILDIVRKDTVANKQIEKKIWISFQQILFEYGIGVEETLKFLYFNRPSTQDFQHWIDARKMIWEKENIEDLPDTLNQEDLEFWEENGYVIIRNAISDEDCQQTQSAILEFLDASIDEPDSWYKNHEAKEGLMVLFTKHPALEKNRQSLKILKAYQQLYKTDRIYRVIDKVSFNPPEDDFFKFRGSSLHWDVSLQTPIPLELQGLLYLTDVKQDSGAFHCVPGFHHKIENWISNLPESSNPREVAVNELNPVPVLGNAGDFIIWHQALPHCATPNTSKLPRMVQYLTYLPEERELDTKPWI